MNKNQKLYVCPRNNLGSKTLRDYLRDNLVKCIFHIQRDIWACILINCQTSWSMHHCYHNWLTLQIREEMMGRQNEFYKPSKTLIFSLITCPIFWRIIVSSNHLLKSDRQQVFHLILPEFPRKYITFIWGVTKTKKLIQWPKLHFRKHNVGAQETSLKQKRRQVTLSVCIWSSTTIIGFQSSQFSLLQYIFYLMGKGIFVPIFQHVPCEHGPL